MLAVGIMSGSSLDGVDFCLAEFNFENKEWNYELLDFKTFEYSDAILAAIQHKNHAGIELLKLHATLGNFYSNYLAQFVSSNSEKPKVIGLHGHTYFHSPTEQISIQLGEAQTLATKINIPVISDFRKADVLKNGQGAPLVPIGDELLFGNYDACLNLGGYANISSRTNQQRLAFDICACNKILNFLANQLGLKYDPDGKNALLGNIDSKLLGRLNNNEFFSQNAPKSLADECCITCLDFLTNRTFPYKINWQQL